MILLSANQTTDNWPKPSSTHKFSNLGSFLLARSSPTPPPPPSRTDIRTALAHDCSIHLAANGENFADVAVEVHHHRCQEMPLMDREREAERERLVYEAQETIGRGEFRRLYMVFPWPLTRRKHLLLSLAAMLFERNTLSLGARSLSTAIKRPTTTVTVTTTTIAVNDNERQRAMMS